MKKILGIIIIVVLFFLLAVFSGIIPVFDILDNGTTTQNYHHGNLQGYGELIGPNERKGFIISHINDGFSQPITAMGRLESAPQGVPVLSSTGFGKYQYKVYGKTSSASGWELLSKPGQTSQYLSNPNPGEVDAPSAIQSSGHWNADPYTFEFVGTAYKAVKVEFYGYIDWNTLNPFDDGYKWRLCQSDEAYLFEGWGSLSYPVEDGVPRSTFEIGETVKILVKTHYGGDTAENGKAWKVVLRQPADRGGEVLKEESYADNVETYFTFTITNGMYSKTSDNTYTVEILNTLVPKGRLYTKTIDILGNAPSDLEITGPTQVKNGATGQFKITASINDETQLPLDYFQIAVFYGAQDTLMPSDPFSNRWILPLTPIHDIIQSGSIYSYTLNVKPNEAGYEGYVTIVGWAYDTEGRSSLHPYKFSFYVYKDVPVPDETIEDEVGGGYYYGGHTEGWNPWDPSGGNWEQIVFPFSLEGIIVAILIILVFALLGFFIFRGNPHYLVGIIILGVIIAILVYFIFFTDVFTEFFSTWFP